MNTRTIITSATPRDASALNRLALVLAVAGFVAGAAAGAFAVETWGGQAGAAPDATCRRGLPEGHAAPALRLPAN